MYIEPNTTIILLKGVPLDNTYTHTIFFESASAQYTHFSTAYTNKRYERLSYQRVNRGRIRLQVRADSIYDYNYLMFKNTSYGDKSFYAFITSIEYINDSTTEINFELDVMQTWFFDITLKESFVEREHSSTDIVGSNIKSEPVSFGELYSDTAVSTGFFDSLGFVIVAPYTFPIGDVPEATHSPEYITGNPSCVHHMYYHSIYQLANDLDKLTTNYSDPILCCYTIPSYFMGTSSEDNRVSLPTTTSVHLKTFGSKPTKLGAYTPVNKKLLTYPYNYFTIETYDGDSRDYAYEFFSGEDVEFNISSNLTSNVSFRCVPLNYKNQPINEYEGTVLSDFPMVAFSTDAYRAWVAQNKTRLSIQGIESLFGASSGLSDIIGGFNTRTPVYGRISKAGVRKMERGIDETLDSGSRGIASIVSQCASAKHLGSRAQGTADGSLEIAVGIKDFNYIHRYLNPVDAKMLDDYFSMYGYAVGLLKVPNRNVRPHWTYTKTVGCNLVGNAPADDVREICNIYDKGITFWRNGSEVGDYSLDNSLED